MTRANLLKNVFFSISLLIMILPLAHRNAYPFGLGDIVKVGKGAIDVAEKGYQKATNPLRKSYEFVYHNTIRGPHRKLKNFVNDATPEKIRNWYKHRIEANFRPLSDNAWEVSQGKIRASEGIKNMVKRYEKQFKGLVLEPHIRFLYDLALGLSEPLPESMVNKLEKHWSLYTSRPLHSDARFLVSRHVLDLINAYGIFGTERKEGMTFYDVIIVDAPLKNTIPSTALLGHELIHVAQFRDMGFEAFVMSYAYGVAKDGYEESTLEREAYSFQGKIEKRLESPQYANSYGSERSINTDKIRAVNFLAISSACKVDNSKAVKVAISDAISRNDHDTFRAVAAFSLNEKGVSDNAKSYVCRMIASNSGRLNVGNSEAINWAKLAIHYDSHNVDNWYFLAKKANEIGDIRTEYEALMNMSILIIDNELRRSIHGRMTPNLNYAVMCLQNAANIVNLCLNNRRIQDNRMPFLSLVMIGLELRPSWCIDNAMVGYINQLGYHDNLYRRADYLHFQILDIISRAYWRIGEAYRNRNYMVMAYNTCNLAKNQFRMYRNTVRGLDPNYGKMMWERSKKIQDRLRKPQTMRLRRRN